MSVETSVELALRTATLVLMGTVRVSLWTLRVALAARGRRLVASATAGVEAVVFALVFASVLSRLESPVEVGGYALGVAAGTLLGVAGDARLSRGRSTVRVVVDGTGDALAQALQARGWPVTRLLGEALEGVVGVLLVVVDEPVASHLLADVHALAPDAFCTVERLQAATTARGRPATDRWRSGGGGGRRLVARHGGSRPSVGTVTGVGGALAWSRAHRRGAAALPP